MFTKEIVMRTSMLEALESRRLLNGLPTISIGDASIVEGNDGSTNAAVVVSLSQRRNQAVTVNYSTQGGTAVAGSDYSAGSGKVTFAAGETAKTILLPVIGDRIAESDESFIVTLQSAKNAKIARSQGTVTVLDNEPRISISSVSDYEGASGTKSFVFTVSLNHSYDEQVTVNYETLDYGAVAGVDYLANSGLLTFNAGDTTKTITVEVVGNTAPEPDKYFLVNLSGASSNASVAYPSGYGTIYDDDGYVIEYYDYGYGYYDYWYSYDSYYGWW
jgi:hypothetical protein